MMQRKIAAMLSHSAGAALLAFVQITSACATEKVRANYQAWLDTTVLASVFKIEADPTITKDLLTMVLHEGHLEDALRGGEGKIAHSRPVRDLEFIYFKLYAKLVNVSGRSPEMVSLEIIGKEGYCNASTIRREIRVSNGKLLVQKEVIPPTTNYQCKLDIERIVQNESLLQAGIAKASQTAAFGTSENVKSTKKPSLIKLKEFLVNYYNPKQGTVTFQSLNDDFISVAIRGIRGEVISGSRFWEKIQIFVALFPVSGDLTKFVLILDGQYASGLAAPSDLAYLDMEPAYSAPLNSYGNKMLTLVGEEMKREGPSVLPR